MSRIYFDRVTNRMFIQYFDAMLRKRAGAFLPKKRGHKFREKKCRVLNPKLSWNSYWDRKIPF